MHEGRLTCDRSKKSSPVANLPAARMGFENGAPEMKCPCGADGHFGIFWLPRGRDELRIRSLGMDNLSYGGIVSLALRAPM